MAKLRRSFRGVPSGPCPCTVEPAAHLWQVLQLLWHSMTKFSPVVTLGFTLAVVHSVWQVCNDYQNVWLLSLLQAFFMSHFSVKIGKQASKLCSTATLSWDTVELLHVLKEVTVKWEILYVFSKARTSHCNEVYRNFPTLVEVISI